MRTIYNLYYEHIGEGGQKNKFRHSKIDRRKNNEETKSIEDYHRLDATNQLRRTRGPCTIEEKLAGWQRNSRQQHVTYIQYHTNNVFPVHLNI